MAYLTKAEYLERFDEAETANLTDPDGVTIDDTKLDTAIASASAFINGYLASRYSLPFASTPVEVKDATADLARERLFTLRPNDEVTARADRWRSWLRDVARGTVELVLEEEAVPSGAADIPAVYVPDQVFTDCLLSSFRSRMQ
jgi:phage gp36-like protein